MSIFEEYGDFTLSVLQTKPDTTGDNLHEMSNHVTWEK